MGGPSKGLCSNIGFNMASESLYGRGRSLAAAIAIFLVGFAAFAYDSIAGAVAYVGHSIFSPLYQPDASTRLHVDSMERELRASTLELTPLGERFRAFIRRAMENKRYSPGDGFMGEGVVALPS